MNNLQNQSECLALLMNQFWIDSEWFIGHSGSTYWRKKDSEKAELFTKIEPYLESSSLANIEKLTED